MVCFTRLRRKTYHVGLFGKQGEGKTTVISLLGFMHRVLNGAVVFSNYPLGFPHVLIDSLEGLGSIYNYDPNVPKVFCGDDFERWFNARANRSKINKELGDILLDWGKISCSLIYSAKRNQIIDIGLRDATCEFWYPELNLAYCCVDNPLLNKRLKDYLDFLEIVIYRFDENLDELPSIVVGDLVRISKLFDTQTTVSPLHYTV